MIPCIKSIVLTVVFGGAAATVAGCDTDKTPAGPSPRGTPSASATPSSAPAVNASSTSGTIAAAATWAGSYKSEPGTIYVPTEVANGKDWKEVKWRGDLSNAGLGDGPMTLAFDPSGRASGTIEGPLGPARINGQMAGDTLTASITRQDPSDGGFVGTLIGKVTEGKLTGTMKLSQREASIIRSATFSAAKK